jgi:hypothetical protein
MHGSHSGQPQASGLMRAVKDLRSTVVAIFVSIIAQLCVGWIFSRPGLMNSNRYERSGIRLYLARASSIFRSSAAADDEYASQTISATSSFSHNMKLLYLPVLLLLYGISTSAEMVSNGTKVAEGHIQFHYDDATEWQCDTVILMGVGTAMKAESYEKLSR